MTARGIRKSYGRQAPKSIPQDVWDRAVALWLDLSSIDNDDIMRIANALIAEKDTSHG